MARRSPLLVNQTYETGCTSRMFRIFDFHSYSGRRFVSNRKHFNAHDSENGNSRSRSDVLSTIDEKNPHIGVSSTRRDYSCKNISCVDNDLVADFGNEVTKMIVNQRLINKYYQGKDGTGCQPNQFLDALHILYSNKELFIKLLQDPNSLLVKQIHDLQSSQVKEPYQARQKRMTRLNKSRNSNVTQCVKPLRSFDIYDSSSSCNPQSSNTIVVLKPGTIAGKTSADTSFGCPLPNSPNSFSSGMQNIKPSHFPLGRIKRKLRHVMKVKRKEQQSRTDDGVPCKFPCSWQGLEDGKNVKELEIAGRNSPLDVNTSIGKRLNSYLDLEKRDKIIKFKDSEFCIGQEAASFGESISRNTDNTLVSHSEQDILNIHVKGRKGSSQKLNCGVEECKQCINSLGRTVALSDMLSLPSLRRYCKHNSITEEISYYNNSQVVLRTKLGLKKEGENGSCSHLGQKIKDPPVTVVDALSDKLQLFGEDTSIRNGLPGNNVHAHYDIPGDGRQKDSSIQNININNTIGRSGSFLDWHPEIRTSSFSPEFPLSSLSFCHRTEDTLNMDNRVEDPRTESVDEQFNGNDVNHFTNPPITIFQPDESPVQVMHANFEENHYADLIKYSCDPTNNLTSSKDILDYVREVLQVISLKWDELTMKRSSDQLLDPSTFDELKELTGQLSGSGGTILPDCVIETFMKVYQNCGFQPHISTKYPNVQAYVAQKRLVKEITELVNIHFHTHPSQLTLEQIVENDLARRGSWLNIQVDTENIAIEVEEYVLEKLVLEMACEMDIREVAHCNEPMSTLLGR